MATIKNEVKELKVTKPILIAELQSYPEYKDKKTSALLALKKEVLISYLNKLKGVESDKPVIDEKRISEIKNDLGLNLPKQKKVSKASITTSGFTTGMDFEGEILATEADLVHFAFSNQ